LRRRLSPARYDTPLIEAIESLYHRSFIQYEDDKIKTLQIIREYILSVGEGFAENVQG
jgi:hypothetical protein